MPGINKPKPLIDFDSVSFPPPTPEAELWQPDPDSVARPGVLPDRRFTQDQFEPYRRAAYKSSLAVASPSPELNSMRSLGACPAPVTRGTGLPRDLLDIQPSTASSFNGLAVQPANDTKSDVLSLGSKISAAVELMEAADSGPSYRPLTPARAPMSPPPKTSPAKGVGSDWMKKMDKALAEDNKKDDKKANGAHSVYVPPHLRKALGASSTTGLSPDVAAFNSFNVSNVSNISTVPKVSNAPKVSNIEEDFLNQFLAKAVIKEEDRLDDEGIAWQLAAGEVGGGDGEKDILKLQQDLLSQSTPNPVSNVSEKPVPLDRRSPLTYEHKEKTMLIRMMESEMDLGKVATMNDLKAMSSSEIDSYYLKVRSAHKNWWEAEQAS